MKCHKCAKPAVVHLTEVITEADTAGMGEIKRAVELHLCLGHAVEAGLLLPSHETPSKAVTLKPEAGVGAASIEKTKGMDEEESAGAIVPAHPEPSGLAVARNRSTDPLACPICGMNWNQFKSGGLMGCPHDYEQFDGKLLPLLKRAQEGATEHVGKVPAGKKTPQGDRQVMTLRLRRELQQAVNAEKYEQAAQLRDKLRQLEEI